MLQLWSLLLHIFLYHCMVIVQLWLSLHRVTLYHYILYSSDYLVPLYGNCLLFYITLYHCVRIDVVITFTPPYYIVPLYGNCCSCDLHYSILPYTTVWEYRNCCSYDFTTRNDLIPLFGNCCNHDIYSSRLTCTTIWELLRSWHLLFQTTWYHYAEFVGCMCFTPPDLCNLAVGILTF